jgi:hypothetical protein
MLYLHIHSQIQTRKSILLNKVVFFRTPQYKRVFDGFYRRVYGIVGVFLRINAQLRVQINLQIHLGAQRTNFELDFS